MRKGYPILCFAVLATAVTTAAPTAASPCETALRAGFANPPPDVKIGCYYYWVNERVLDDGTRIRFTEQSLFEVVFPDGRTETWNPVSGEIGM